MRTGLAQNLSNWRLFSFFARLRLTYESCLVKRMCVIMWNGTTESVPSSYRTYTLCTSLLYIDCNLWKYILSVTGKMKHYVTFNHCYQRIREVNSAHIHGNNIPSLLYGEELYGCSVAKLQKQLQVSRNVTAKSEKKMVLQSATPNLQPPPYTHTHILPHQDPPPNTGEWRGWRWSSVMSETQTLGQFKNIITTPPLTSCTIHVDTEESHEAGGPMAFSDPRPVLLPWRYCPGFAHSFVWTLVRRVSKGGVSL